MKNSHVIFAAAFTACFVLLPLCSFAADSAINGARDTGTADNAGGSALPIDSQTAPDTQTGLPAPSPSVTPASAQKPVEIKVIEITDPAPPINSGSPDSSKPQKTNTALLAVFATAFLGGLAWIFSKFFSKGSTEKTYKKDDDSRCEDIKSLLEQKLRELEETAKSWPEDKLKELLIAKTLTEEQKALLAKYQSAKEKYENLKKAAELLRGKYDLCMLKLPSAGQKKVFIIHGWGGHPDEHWLPWLKKELESKSFTVLVPQMPDTENPKIEAWVNYLKEIVGEPDENTFFVGHSIGCQAIMRYVEKLDNIKSGGAVFVAGWFNLDNLEDDEYEISGPWIETPLDFKKIKNSLINPPVVFLSDNEPYGFIEENKKIFIEKLGAEVIIEKHKGHFTHDNGIVQMPEVLSEILKLADSKK